jgi:hypothetical protein
MTCSATKIFNFPFLRAGTSSILAMSKNQSGWQKIKAKQEKERKFQNLLTKNKTLTEYFCKSIFAGKVHSIVNIMIMTSVPQG